MDDAPPPGEVWLSAVISGIGDCFFGLAVALVKRGLLTRADLAEIYGQVVEQGTARQRKATATTATLLGALSSPTCWQRHSRCRWLAIGAEFASCRSTTRRLRPASVAMRQRMILDEVSGWVRGSILNREHTRSRSPAG
jgi:hypothetical protein